MKRALGYLESGTLADEGTLLLHVMQTLQSLLTKMAESKRVASTRQRQLQTSMPRALMQLELPDKIFRLTSEFSWAFDWGISDRSL